MGTRSVPFIDELHDPAWTGLLPPLRASYRVDLTGSSRIEHLEAVDAPVVVLAGCSSLRSLPSLPAVIDLDLSRCGALTSLDDVLPGRMGRLDLRGCHGLTSFPGQPTRLAELDVSGSGITSLPEVLQIDRCLHIDGPMATLPSFGPAARLCYRGVEIPPAAVLEPDQLDPSAVLDEPNLELRRTLVELLGYHRFLDLVKPRVLDEDVDPGGARRLVALHPEHRLPRRLRKRPETEPFLCLEVRCPSSGRAYLLRVPPDTATCRQAAAWIAGFDHPDDYQPLVET